MDKETKFPGGGESESSRPQETDLERVAGGRGLQVYYCKTCQTTIVSLTEYAQHVNLGHEVYANG
ncbi:MAG: hypothetical protein BAA02_13450 [Paenibacillaceae bacterium ZCTH02-B3]|nr:MAG: hypothetical protein BAA02_13450 [Paenibacillaceae bacterium ZCTH02-B3]